MFTSGKFCLNTRLTIKVFLHKHHVWAKNTLNRILILYLWWSTTSITSSIALTDLPGEVMVNSQAQSLFLQGNQGRWALLTTRNFPVRHPKAGIRRHGSSTYGPASERHCTPDAVSYGSGEGHVRWGSVCSLAHIPTWVAPGSSGTLRSRALLGLAVFPFNTCRKAEGLTVMLHFWALRNKSL